jgi:Basic region leucine zipper
VHTPPSSTGDQDDLLLNSSFPDLAAQLELWTNIAFDTDEPHVEKHLDDKSIDSSVGSVNDLEEEEAMTPAGPATDDAHDHVVTGRPALVGNNPGIQNIQPPQPQFDLTNFLAGFGIDPLLVPHLPHQQQHATPSLAQLLAAHGAPAAPSSSMSFSAFTSQPPATYRSASAASSSEQSGAPAAKRSRTRKASVSPSEAEFLEHDESAQPNITTPLSAAEDKRRRNTAASARFRLKKKEREVALETKSKDLEVRVNELERECEGLRRENGWLKGLVVGVTGGAPTSAPISASAGTKRSREIVDA